MAYSNWERHATNIFKCNNLYYKFTRERTKFHGHFSQRNYCNLGSRKFFQSNKARNKKYFGPKKINSIMSESREVRNLHYKKETKPNSPDERTHQQSCNGTGGSI